MKNDNLIIESVSNGPLFGQTFNVEMINSLPALKENIFCLEFPLYPTLLNLNYFH